MRHRAPLADRVLLGLLGSPLRLLVDGGLCALRYRTRTGATVTFPVRYGRDEEGIVVRCAHADEKRWWRHFWRPAAVEVWLDGRWRTGVARVVGRVRDVVTVRVEVGARVAPLSGRRLFRSWPPVVATAQLSVPSSADGVRRG